MSETKHPITDRMLAKNGLRCPCSEKPIELCYHLETLANRLADALEAEEKHQWAKRNREAISDPLDERILGLKMEVERTAHEAATLRRATLAEFAAMKEGL